MAYIKSSAFKSGVLGTSISVDAMPEHETGDVIVAFYGGDDAPGTGVWTTPTGYTPIVSGGGSSVEGASFFKVATSSSETAPLSDMGLSEELVHYIVILADVDTSDVIEDSAIFTLSSDEIQAPAISPINDDTLILWWHIADSSRQQSIEPGVMALDLPQPISASVSASASWTYQFTGGASVRPKWFINSTATDGMQVQSIAFNSSTNITPGHVPFSSPPTTIIHPLRSIGTAGPFGGGSIDPSLDLVGGISGNNFNYQVISQIAAAGPNGYFNALQIDTPNSGSANEIWGAVWDLSAGSVNLTSKLLCMHVGVQAGFSFGSIDTVNNGGYIVGLRSVDGGGKAYRFWNVSALDSIPSAISLHVVTFDPSDTGLVYDTIGNFDITQVDGIFISGNKGASIDMRITFSECHVMNPVTIIGGDASLPANMETFTDALKASNIFSISNQSGSSNKQLFSRHNLQIGNGSDATFFKDINSSVQFSPVADASERRIQHNISDTSTGLLIKASSADTINLSSEVWSGPSGWPFTFDATSSASATYITDALSIIGADVVLQDVFTAQSGITFGECLELTHNNADLSGGCTIDASTDTNSIRFTGSTQSALQALINNVSNCTFSNNTTAIRVEYTGTGDITINFDNVNWSSNTTDIHYNSTNASTLTANMANGANASSTAISGSAVAVVIAADVTVTFANLQAGSQLTVLQAGTQTEDFHVESTGTSENWTFTAPLGHSFDYQILKGGFIAIWSANNSAVTVNTTINIDQQEDPSYEA